MELYGYFIEEVTKRRFFKKEKLINEYYVVKLNDVYHYYFRNQKENHLVIFVIEYGDNRNYFNDYHRKATEEEKEYFLSKFKENPTTIKLKEIHNYKKYRFLKQNYLSGLIPHFIRRAGIKFK
jgi:hypothetical protein